MAFSVISTMEGSVDVLRFSSYLMSLGSKRPGGGGCRVHAEAALCPCRHLQRGEEEEEEALPLVQAVMLLPIRWLTESSTASRPFLSQT